MNVFQSIRRAFSRKDSQARTLIAQVATGPYAPMPKDYRSFAEEGYQKNVIAYRSVALLGGAAGGIGWVLYRKGRGRGSRRRQEVEEHELLNLLKRPNPTMGQSTFMEAVFSFKLISGNSYIEAVSPKKDSIAKVRELWPLRPDRMRVVPGVRGFPAGYIYTIGSSQTRFQVDQVSLQSPVLHWKFFHPTDDWYGLSPVEAAAMGVDQHNSANKWNIALMQNAARPSGALVATVSERSSGTLTEAQFQRLKQQIEESYSGAANAGRPMVLEGGLDWKGFSFSPQQMEWIENKNTSARDISLAFGVPPMLLGIPGDNTYSNYQEARAAFYEETVIPQHDSFRDELNNWLIAAADDRLELDSDKDSIHALAPRRQAYWDKVSAASHLTVNEKREATGYEPYEGGDVILVSSTQVSLEDATAPVDDPEGGDTSDYQNSDPADQQDQEDSGKSVKVFNLDSAKEKAQEWRSQQRSRMVHERRLKRQARTVFEIEGHRVAAAVKGFDIEHAKAAALREIDANQAQWRTILKANLAATSKTFGSRVFGSLKGVDGAPERKDSESEFDRLMLSWIEQHVGERIKNIGTTTKERVLKAIRDAEAEAYASGESLGDLSQKIEAAYEGFSAARAVTIARTETGTAANVAMTKAAKATGIPGLKKEWVWTNDERTREDHQLADPVVGIDEEFDVGGFKMGQPMDPKGPPGEVINCRCGIVFSTGDEQ